LFSERPFEIAGGRIGFIDRWQNDVLMVKSIIPVGVARFRAAHRRAIFLARLNEIEDVLPRERFSKRKKER
jgi:hypothetical protein